MAAPRLDPTYPDACTKYWVSALHVFHEFELKEMPAFNNAHWEDFLKHNITKSLWGIAKE